MGLFVPAARASVPLASNDTPIAKQPSNDAFEDWFVSRCDRDFIFIGLGDVAQNLSEEFTREP